jgi:hypothetical protein
MYKVRKVVTFWTVTTLVWHSTPFLAVTVWNQVANDNINCICNSFNAFQIRSPLSTELESWPEQISTFVLETMPTSSCTFKIRFPTPRPNHFEMLLISQYWNNFVFHESLSLIVLNQEYWTVCSGKLNFNARRWNRCAIDSDTRSWRSLSCNI